MIDPNEHSHLADGGEAEATALALTRGFLAEVHPGTSTRRALTLDSALERDLGLDSLSRVELAVRLERALHASLSDEAVGGAMTLRDLLAAVREAAGLPAAAARPAQQDIDAPTGTPEEATTLVEVLEWHVRAHPDRVQIIQLADGGETRITYRDLMRAADAVAAGLQALGLEPGDTVAIMLPTCPEYFHTYFGILAAGGVPVPIYPPARLDQIEEHVRRHAGILTNAEAKVLITVPEARAVARLLEARVADLDRIVTVPELIAAGREKKPVALKGNDIAFLQYTSGSTGDPKGVVLTHANLLANIRAIRLTIKLEPTDVFVSWLPLYHDMGLICAWLASLYCATPLVVMSPLAFLVRPERWLRAIADYRGTVSAAPNFAYELCVKRIAEADIEGLNLSSWRLAANGAEPVMPETLARFTSRFAPRGLRPEALTPVYGLAESTVGLLCPPLGRVPRIDRVRRDTFSSTGRAEPAAPDDTHALRFVSCGVPIHGHAVRIVDAIGGEAAERVEGRLEFSGPSATAGYYRNPEATARLLDGEWRDTGDRAYLADGEVFITGRVKDIIIRGGRNIHPHELEDAIGTVPGVRRGCVAVFGSADAATGTERLIVLAETHISEAAERDALRERIIKAAVAVQGEAPDDVVLAPARTVLKTSSGKIRRAACRELYESGQIGTAGRAAWWQLARLAAGSLAPQVRRVGAAAGALAYGCYCWCVFALLAPPAWLFTALAPNAQSAWSANRLAARAILALCGIPFRVSGREHILSGTCVVVANHASYMDGIALAAALPRHVSFVAKREFLANPVARIYMRGLGVYFVERFDTRKGVENARELADAVKAGASLGIFPEGTFGRAAGLASFRLGAFVAAATADVAVLPVAIRGTRAMLRDGQALPRHGAIEVTIGAALFAPADAPDTFSAALALRDGARAHILAHCGEADAGPS